MEKTYIIYKHTNLINQKIYIGITSHSEDPNLRWKNGRGYEQNDVFFSDILKYGWENFSHEIIEEGLNRAEAMTKEIEYIQKYDSINQGYNKSKGGNIPSEEGRKKISQALTGIKRSPSSINKQIQTKILNSGFSNGYDPISTKTAKKVRCKETGDIFGSISEACNWSNTTKVCDCCNGKRKHAGRHPETNILLSWEYAPEDSIVTKRSINKRKRKNINKVQCIETQKIYNNASEASLQTGIATCNILRVCKGERYTAGGYHWTFIKEGENI